MYFLSTFLSIAVLLALLVPGFILRKTHIVSDAAAKDLSGILIYIGLPAMIFYCMMSVDITLVTPVKVIVCFLLSIAVHVFGLIVVKIAFRRSEDAGRKAAASFSAVFSNCGFIGIPLTTIAVQYCDAFADTDSALSEAMLYVTIFNVVFNLLNWTLGRALFGSGEKKSVMLKKALLNPCTIATIVALPFTLTGFSLLDPIVVGDFEITQLASFITYLYNICVPVSMCVLGIRLADIKVVEMVRSKYIYAASAIKLVLIPAVFVGICLLLDLWLDIGAPLVITMTVMAATPSATTALAFAERFDGDTVLAGECIMSSTLLSIITVPLFLMLVVALV